jgi:hypothetical protein
MTEVRATFQVRGRGSLSDFSKAFKAIVAERTELLDEEVRAAGFKTPFITVNGREAKTYANTELFDVIRVAPESPPVPEATREAYGLVVSKSPVLSGAYKSGFLVLASGVPVSSIPSRAGVRSVFSIVNIMRYASPLEALLFMRAASVMYAASLQIRIRYAGAVKVSFSYRTVASLPVAQRTGRGNSYPTAFPVIEIGGPSSNVQDGSVRPVSPRASRRARDAAIARSRARQEGGR